MKRLRVGNGVSRLDDATAAGSAAAADAVTGLEGDAAGLVVVYASIRYDLPALIAGVRSVTGETPLIGASSCGQFANHEYVAAGEGVVVLVLGAGPYQFGTASVTGLRADSTATGRELARATLDAAGPDRAPHGAMVVLADGLAGTMQDLLTGLYRVTGAAIPVVGGAASDDRTFSGTYVFHNDQVLADGAVAAWVGSERPLRVVSGHGWTAAGLPLLVTKVEGQVVHEIAGRPAMEVYQEGFRQGAPISDAGDARGNWYTAHSFGLIEPDGTQVIRGAFVSADAQLRTFAPLPPYCAVQIVSANQDELLDVSEQVVADALADVEDPAVMLTFSCVARADLLGERGGEEVARLHKAASPVTTFGFYTYGEFARTTSVAGYHNATITALAL